MKATARSLRVHPLPPRNPRLLFIVVSYRAADGRRVWRGGHAGFSGVARAIRWPGDAPGLPI